MTDEKLLETVADIAYHAGSHGYFSGDSRADTLLYIHWARAFESLHSQTDWNDVDYLLEIEQYVSQALQSISG